MEVTQSSLISGNIVCYACMVQSERRGCLGFHIISLTLVILGAYVDDIDEKMLERVIADITSR